MSSLILNEVVDIIKDSCISHKHATASTTDWSGIQPSFGIKYVLCMQCEHSIDSLSMVYNR